jgi:hypothetical protein
MAAAAMMTRRSGLRMGYPHGHHLAPVHFKDPNALDRWP